MKIGSKTNVIMRQFGRVTEEKVIQSKGGHLLKMTIMGEGSGHHLDCVTGVKLIRHDVLLKFTCIVGVYLKVKGGIEVIQVQAEVPLFLSRIETAQLSGQLEGAQIEQVVTCTLILQVVAVVHWQRTLVSKEKEKEKEDKSAQQMTLLYDLFVCVCVCFCVCCTCGSQTSVEVLGHKSIGAKSNRAKLQSSVGGDECSLRQTLSVLLHVVLPGTLTGAARGEEVAQVTGSTLQAHAQLVRRTAKVDTAAVGGHILDDHLPQQ